MTCLINNKYTLLTKCEFQSKILLANYLFKQLLLHEPQKERQRKINMLFISFWKSFNANERNANEE
ncbi:hypothetical protein T4B_6903 [Trichinella pseudospiralis]|uniref:Uncharacterized protein n=1 Tax=Trichinella pseudospiralis TaxID=6337 RepID=A0A0V1J2P9_TRIPS|nr:hypothetical protein T4B_6903 [Trichinella pseudospiralis]KRZ29096.1 hypothetical protein T4C_11787 [Trichinella pseudospiralis]